MKKYLIVAFFIISGLKLFGQTNSSETSLYNLNSEWKTQGKKLVHLKDFEGKVQVMALIYTSCQYACPRIIADLRKIENKIEPKDRDQVVFLLVSMDPKKDTPRRMAKFGKENNFDPNSWILLNGKEKDVRELANVLNVRYKRLETGEIDHSNAIHILNRTGEVVYQQIGLEADPKQSLEEINKLINQK